ncbi:GL24177 [Drosophila persimilis]|uniref:cGMP-specific 3',5'-cyclic phosphodiesterase n=1 Tax=Drosophila persimilis TaxID=7234 RepID=PDE6_DROPE|nr:RecName: Full=cGMP-specific 3',5'-cyclic phosphodiesterase; Flags: Precursor [Drosophila persimilis]EDW24493.1 GL24177 [Drosophila persimilis]
MHELGTRQRPLSSSSSSSSSSNMTDVSAAAGGATAPAETAATSSSASKPLTNGANKTSTAMAAPTTTPTTAATAAGAAEAGAIASVAGISNQVKLEHHHRQSNNNRPVAPYPPVPAAKPKPTPTPTAESKFKSTSREVDVALRPTPARSSTISPGVSIHTQTIQQESSSAKPGMSSSSSSAQQDVDEVARLFEEKPEAFEKWLTERAPPEALSRLQEFIESRKPLKRPSVTSDLFQQWMSASPTVQQKSPRSLSNSSASSTLPECRRHLMDLDEGELFMELIRDVANELDIDVLCHKILVNVGLLTHADRGSLFLAKGTPHNKYLVAKLFDVTQKTALKDAVTRASAEEIIIPFGIGIAGMVAQTKQMINIKEAYKDARFNCEIDLKTGYKTNAILCMPICNYEGDIIGVAQIINKTNGCMEFDEHDVEIFRRYLTFCGIGIQNAQLFEMSVQEYRRNQILLNLARSIFEEQNNLECLVTKIMTEARELLNCERCSVFLVDLDCCEASHLEKIIEKPNQPEQRPTRAIMPGDSFDEKKMRNRFTVLFELGGEYQAASVSRPSKTELSTSTLAQIAQFVATTGQTVNICDVHEWVRDHNQIRAESEIDSTQAILCMPIVNAQKIVIGVAQLINKANGVPFTESDASIFEAFAIFCGLGIHNTQMYENACKLMAKQKVALECLSYHATASQDQTEKLTQDAIAEAESYNLYSFTFTDFELVDDDTCRAVLRMFLQCNLVSQFQIPYDVLCRWVLSVRKNYRPVKYHNWRHALNVAQTMFAMLKTGKMERFMTDLEILGLLVACLCHDLDHRGTNNAFQTKTESPLAILYTTSTMEHHHFDQCVMILNSEGNNIFQPRTTRTFLLLARRFLRFDLLPFRAFTRALRPLVRPLLELDVLELPDPSRIFLLTVYLRLVTRTIFLPPPEDEEEEDEVEDSVVLVVASVVVVVAVAASVVLKAELDVEALSPEDYRSVMKTVESAILSTDLAMYFKKRNAFLELVENGEFDWQGEEKKDLLCGMMMTACDVSAIAKPWEVQHKVAKLVADEFFDQGDLEKLQLNTQPVAMMDRERKDELPKMQVGFIDVICLPLYRVLCDTFPWITPLYEGTLENRRNWQDLAEKVEMGLTWIDHDTIDKPVEEFAGCADEEIKDIEFTVTTLNCNQQAQHGAGAGGDDSHTPEHQRSGSRLSMKKTGALGKAVRSKLSKTLYNSMDGSKPKTSLKLLESHVSEDMDDKSPTSPSQPPHAGGSVGRMSASSSTSSAGTVVDKSKKRSKLCSLL